MASQMMRASLVSAMALSSGDAVRRFRLDVRIGDVFLGDDDELTLAGSPGRLSEVIDCRTRDYAVVGDAGRDRDARAART